MTDGSVHNMSLMVGQLMGKVDGLAQSIQSLERVWGEREKVAVEGRRVVHEKVDALRHDLMMVGADVENMTHEITTVIKPAVTAFNTKEAEGVGAHKVKLRVWAGISFLASLGGGGIAELFHRLR